MGGIFTLGQVNIKRAQGTLSENVWLNPRIVSSRNRYGYFAGGRTGAPATISTVSRVDFDNDTSNASLRGSLSVARYGMGATGNLTHGYFAGGKNPSVPANYSTVDRVDYSNDTPTMSPKGPLSSAKNFPTATGTISYGYFGGGSSPLVSTVDRIDYSNDGVTVVAKGPLTAAKYMISATGTNSYGYFGGGSPSPGSAISHIDRLDYSSDTTATAPKGPLSAVKYTAGATGNANYGWWGGGDIGPGTSSLVSRLDYSSDTTTAVEKGPLSVVKPYTAATGNRNFGYWGASGSNVTPTSTVDRVDFASDTGTALTRGPLYTAAYAHAGASASANALPTSDVVSDTSRNLGTDYGYLAGGDAPSVPGQVSLIQRIDFSNDTATARQTIGIPGNREKCVSMGTSDYAWIQLGDSATIVTRLNYANDTGVASPRGNIVSTQPRKFGLQSPSAGYMGGGYPGVSTIDRINFANDTVDGIQRGYLSAGRYQGGGVGTEYFGYVCGGYSASATVSVVDRLDFANDTATMVAKGPLNSNVPGGSGMGNKNYGWISLANQSVDRIDYSNDTATASPRGGLSVNHGNYAGATGNKSYGYFMGGNPGLSTIDRIDYSNDSPTATAKGPLAVGVRWVQESAISSKENGIPVIDHGGWFYNDDRGKNIHRGFPYGYVGGGGIGPLVSNVNRIDFASDTDTASVKGYLGENRYDGDAISSINYGYFMGGGQGPTAAKSSQVNRLDYSNDSPNLLVRGPLSVAKYGNRSGTGTEDYGYSTGGSEYPASPSSTSHIDRLDWSNDLATALHKGNLTRTSCSYGAGVGNSYYGYSCGQESAPGKTLIDRIDYGNDTATALAKGNLNVDQGYASGGGNHDYGWIGGGNANPGITNISRISYANDTVTALSKGSMVTGTYAGGTIGASDRGYWAMGTTQPSSPPPSVTITQRLDYANDTLGTVTKGNTTYAKYGVSAVCSQEDGLGRKLALESFAFGNNPTSDYPYGYIGGGYNAPLSPGVLSAIERIDFANDTTTASVRGPLSIGAYAVAATGNHDYGWWGARRSPSSPQTSWVDRIDYSNDSIAAPARGLMTAARYKTTAAGNTSYGYFAGGVDPGANDYTNVDRIDYANDTALATERGYLSTKRNALAASSNNDYAWFGGGMASGTYGKTTVDRLDFASDTTNAVAKGPLTVARYYLGASGNPDFGYFGGGRFYSGPTGGVNYSVVDRVDYSNDTGTAITKGTLSATRYGLGGTGNTSYGYYGGGAPGPGAKSEVDRVDYSSDTSTAIAKNPLNVARSYCAAVSSKENALSQTYLKNYIGSSGFGYFVGGNVTKDIGPTTINTATERIDFANDTANAVLRAPISTSRKNPVGSTGNQNFGYTAGSYSPDTSIMDRLDYANDSSIMLQRGPLSIARGLGSGASGNSGFGYWYSGGWSPNRTTIDRLDYGSDTTTAVAKGPLTTANYGGSTVGNKNYGWCAGGLTPTGTTVIQRIDYSNDTPNASPRGHLTEQRYTFSATGNEDYGFYAGGSGKSTIDRLDFANDGVTCVVKGRLSLADQGSEATGNSNFGYFAGGGNFPATPKHSTRIERMDYSNDNVGAVVRSHLTIGRYGDDNGVSNRMGGLTIFGSYFAQPVQMYPSSQRIYWVGGNADNYNVQRFITATDTVQAVVRYRVTNAKGDKRSGVGNQYYGYVSVTTNTSHIERLDYSNDTGAPTTSHLYLANIRSTIGGATNKDYGYMAGGTPSISYVDRIDFGNDTATTLTRGNLSSGTTHCRGVGNANYGYFSGYDSSVQRVNYANDLAASLEKANGLSGWGHNAAGNANYGYFGGGGPGSSRTDVHRIDYSSDTTAVAPKGPLVGGRSEHAAAIGNISYGYWGGGEPDSSNDSRIDRIDYSNDTATALSRGTVSNRLYNSDRMSGGQDALPQ